MFISQDVQDPSVIVTFPLLDEPKVSLVAWTTTPWTLPSNLALCVNPELIYIKLRGEWGPKYSVWVHGGLLHPGEEMNSSITVCR